MDAKTEAMPGTMCMNPQMLINMYVQSEQCEAALYAQLCRIAPTPCLQQTIAQMAMKEKEQAAKMCAVAAAYGLGATDPPAMFPQFYSVEEKKE